MELDMKLPNNQRCFDCTNHDHCRALFQCDGTNTHCDFSPSRFKSNAFDTLPDDYETGDY